MTELVYTKQALVDLERLSDFLLETDPQAATKTTLLIFEALEIWRITPRLASCRPHPELTLRHQRESGYKGL